MRALPLQQFSHSQGQDEDAYQAYKDISGLQTQWGQESDKKQALSKLRIEAKKKYKTAITLESLSGRSPIWTQAKAGDFETISEADVIVHHHNDFVADHVLGMALSHLDEIYSKLSGQEKRSPFNPPLLITIHRNADEYHEKTGQPEWTGGVTLTRGTPTQVTHREVVFYQTSHFDSVIQHELTHALLPTILNRGPGIPRWIEEGMAVSNEPSYKIGFYKKSPETTVGSRRLLPCQHLDGND